MPKNIALPYEWYDTPNIHLCSIKDLQIFEKKGIKINEFLYLTKRRKVKCFMNNFQSLSSNFFVSKNKIKCMLLI